MNDPVIDAKAAESLITAAIESCVLLHKRLSGAEAASLTKIASGLRLARDRIGDVLDEIDPSGASRRS